MLGCCYDFRDTTNGVYTDRVSKSFIILHSRMKTLQCDLCEATAEGETFEAWMQALMPHYMQAHADVMNDSKHGKEEQMQWMKENKARFEAA